MHLLLSIITTFALMAWPLMVMMSPMMLAAPGAVDNKAAVLSVMLFLLFPVGIFILFGLFGINYLGINSFLLAKISAVVVCIVFVVFGYSSLFINMIKGVPNSGYAVVNNTVYFSGTVISGADPDSFITYDSKDYENEHSTSLYASDNHSFYYFGKRVSDVDPRNIKGQLISHKLYWLNDTQVVLRNQIIEAANPRTFSNFDDDFPQWNYSETEGKYTVYYDDEILKAVDFDSFTPLFSGYAKDKNHIFYGENIIVPEADLQTFEILTTSYEFARDKSNIYYLSGNETSAINGLDPDSFEEIERNYIKDKSGVYHYSQSDGVQRIYDADVESFAVTDYDESTNSDALDKKHYYMRGEIVSSRSDF
ncbi:DKNYY domain-containing protein [Pseudoalteromonas sp. 1181_04]|uniref:DKNYY domain-containing protein n=1 Tax=Pseudoalteromonas sp. 1181_04 TaxID=2604450 RepID=UPI004062F2E3